MSCARGTLSASALRQSDRTVCFTTRDCGSGLTPEDLMAKGQKHGNREIRKPKKKKEPASDPVGLTKGTSVSVGNMIGKAKKRSGGA